MDARENTPFVSDHDEPALGDIIRADPAPTLKYTIVGVAGVMAGIVIGCVFAHRDEGHGGPAANRAPQAENRP